ncbi:MAG TPA: hypothetical protein PLW60_04815 [Bacilli bacterium]|nr:MAG: hypothetical protein BWY97_00372 [Tenericutes bacterium ADurb.BinA124]HNZ50347.1 hypothetical protein [Bacilli bacterium]HPX83880.1 hypothetical protein [Bacilli bacterium]HQC74828.1 hypothetical protein [Bacilli bacterium]
MPNKDLFKPIIPPPAESSSSLIGTLGEKTIHRLVKTYLEPDGQFHEIKIGSYYADIYRDGHITEIQTGNFNKLRAKLAAFLPAYIVEVVYPSYARKWLRWQDESDGSLSKPRLSPSRGTYYRVFSELYKIKAFLVHPHFRLRIILLDWEEHRYLNGWSLDRKKGSLRKECLPLAIVSEVAIPSPADYIKLVPVALKSPFTTRDFAKAGSLSLKQAQKAVLVLAFLNIIQLMGKQGRFHLYEIN